jgi:hypothetical protein
MRLLLPTLAVTSDTSVLVEEELREELIAGRWLPAHPEMPDWVFIGNEVPKWSLDHINVALPQR